MNSKLELFAQAHCPDCGSPLEILSDYEYEIICECNNDRAYWSISKETGLIERYFCG